MAGVFTKYVFKIDDRHNARTKFIAYRINNAKDLCESRYELTNYDGNFRKCEERLYRVFHGLPTADDPTYIIGKKGDTNSPRFNPDAIMCIRRIKYPSDTTGPPGPQKVYERVFFYNDISHDIYHSDDILRTKLKEFRNWIATQQDYNNDNMMNVPFIPPEE